jgi:dihydroorotate dehydrogenase (NAD+) catalytic subunit
MMTSLKVNIAGIKMSNPTMLASGMMGETGGSLVQVADHGAGAVVTKSIGSSSRDGHKNPTLFESESYFINAMGLPGPGIEEFGLEMKAAVKGKVPVIGSIFASSPKEFADLATSMVGYGASGIELNLSCPHAKGYGMEIGIDPEMVTKIVREVKAAVSVPVLSKLTPNTHRLVEVAKAVEEAGGDGLVAINTVKAMAISVEFRRPVLFNKYGGLSGPAVKPIGLRCVYELYENVSIPIIGVGGVMNWRDALEYVMAGAVAVQVGSAIATRGLDVFEEIARGIESYLEETGCRDVNELVGVAHDR